MRVSEKNYAASLSAVCGATVQKKHALDVNVEVSSFPYLSNTNIPSGLLKAYYLKQEPQPSFKNAPWKINLSETGIPEHGALSAEQGLEIFEKFKLGNYLDTGDDEWNYDWCNGVRKQNLEFLDRITDQAEKSEFINYYKTLTGFPDLHKVSKNIKSAYVFAVLQASADLNTNHNTNRFDILEAGYDGVCSVGRNKALPGSDLDKAYVILRGTGNKYEDLDTVNKFKGKLWEKTDQRILSYNHDFAAFPQVYTIKQVEKLLEAADKKLENIGVIKKYRSFSDLLHGNSSNPKIITKFMPEYYKFKELKNNYDTNYTDACKFYIKLCEQFPRRYNEDLEVDNPSRENIKNFGFVLEALREGNYFENFLKLDYSKLEKSPTFRLANLSQLHALKNHNDMKSKRVARENLVHEFDKWGIDKQFRFVKTLIESSCGNNHSFTDEFPQYFSKPGNDPFDPLIKKLIGD